MDFEWDDAKNIVNFKKHGIDFDVAKEIFAGIWISKQDKRKDYGEDRFIALGLLENFVLLAVYTKRGNTIRLISVRRANIGERKIYYGYIARRTVEDPWSEAEC